MKVIRIFNAQPVKDVISDEWAREEGRNNYFVGTEINAAWAPGRCIMGREKAV